MMAEDLWSSAKQKHVFGNMLDLNPMLTNDLITLMRENELVTSLGGVFVLCSVDAFVKNDRGKY